MNRLHATRGNRFQRRHSGVESGCPGRCLGSVSEGLGGLYQIDLANASCYS